MSLAKLFLSGLLIAGGLILGTFTLHGYFDPQWAQRQALAAGAGERAKEPRAISRFQGRSRFVSSRADPANAGVRPPAATSAGVAASNAIVKASQVKSTAKAPVKKKVAEKPKPPPQQASVWPWNLFAN